MAGRQRRIVWTESARTALDDILTYIAKDSPDAAERVLRTALDAASSLASFAERGRVVPEIGDSTVRELFVFKYRLLYQIRDDAVVVLTVIHGARDFETWQKDQ